MIQWSLVVRETTMPVFIKRWRRKSNGKPDVLRVSQTAEWLNHWWAKYIASSIFNITRKKHLVPNKKSNYFSPMTIPHSIYTRLTFSWPPSLSLCLRIFVLCNRASNGIFLPPCTFYFPCLLGCPLALCFLPLPGCCAGDLKRLMKIYNMYLGESIPPCIICSAGLQRMRPTVVW